MKNVFKSIAAVTVLAFNFAVNAQTQKNENSVLWEVSGNGLVKPSYLFGTIHMICGKDFVMKPKTADAFAKTAKLVLEINMSDVDELKIVQQAAVGKEPLSKTLSTKQIVQLEEVLKNNGGLTLAQVDSYTLETVMSLLFMKSFGCTDLKFYEMEFLAKAKESNKPIVGLEKATVQLDILSKSFTEDELIAYLQKIDSNMTKTMIKEYTSENIDGLYAMTTDKELMSATTKETLLNNRNMNWLKIMPEMMQKESVFFAVGSAHLAGDLGVINLLKKAGYTVKPIMN
ncbi:TraB/GumN family protein [Flavobacterium sp. HJJ]|uniref:TraB/GumN family protein n=1 Tax=Flavobacterium sp. HJJ TaxID=2783792 RepID=UPI00188B01A7|nr:TraB/GumN family protein [Flavobacterium sp. HJJ]MBF4472661.1 TraB/GumN family protein [Flavobacterium sp. HJJ]